MGDQQLRNTVTAVDLASLMAMTHPRGHPTQRHQLLAEVARRGSANVGTLDIPTPSASPPRQASPTSTPDTTDSHVPCGGLKSS